jgi:hypothetical protein
MFKKKIPAAAAAGAAAAVDALEEDTPLLQRAEAKSQSDDAKKPVLAPKQDSRDVEQTGDLSKRTVIGMASTSLVLRVGMTAASMYECMATGIFKDDPILVWLSMYGVLLAVSVVFCLCALCSCNCNCKCKKRKNASGQHVLSRTTWLFILCMFDIISFVIVMSMAGIYTDVYEGDNPFSKSTYTNPRDRLAAWRVLHSSGLTFSAVSASAWIYLLLEVSTSE